MLTRAFLLESDAHRNMSFTLYHAYHTPRLVIDTVVEKNMGNGLREITATISNTRLMPTHSSHDLKHKIERPDLVSIKGATVIAGMIVDNPDLNISTEQSTEPSILRVSNIPGLDQIQVRWIVSGNGKYTIQVDSRKGGVVTYNKK